MTINNIMNTISSKDMKKVIIVSALFIFLVLGIIYIRIIKKPAPAAIPATNTVSSQPTTIPGTPEPSVVVRPGLLKLVFDKTSVSAGDLLTATVYLTAPGIKVTGADVVLLYDPAYFSVSADGISGGSFFSNYPKKTVDSTRGQVKVSGFGVTGDQPPDLNTIFVTIPFQTLKAGTTAVNFDFVQGTTNKSTIVEKGTSKNILGSVENATLIIK
jgi:hypothetical protein